MSGLRIFGIVFGIIIILSGFRIFRGQKWNRLNFFLLVLSGFSLFIVSLNPSILDILQGMFALEGSERGRLLALLILAVIFLWFMVLSVRTAFLKQRLQFDRFVRAFSIEKYAQHIREDLASCDVVVLIPAYNEADNLKELLPRIPRQVGTLRIGVVVVDDGSDDGTCECALSAGAFSVRSPFNRGGGAVLRLGYDILKQANIRICITMDADGQHDPAEIPLLLTPLLEDRFDIVIGSRIIGKREPDSLFRLAGVYFFSFLINRLTGLKITDPSSNFRGFKTDIINRIHLEEDQYHTSELIINAAKSGFRIGEAPITILKRKYGRSKKGKDWQYGIYFARIVFKSWWR